MNHNFIFSPNVNRNYLYIFIHFLTLFLSTEVFLIFIREKRYTFRSISTETAHPKLKISWLNSVIVRGLLHLFWQKPLPTEDID